MAFNVNTFRSQMIGDGARPNLFEVTLVLPTYVTDATSASQKLTFMAKSAQLPGSSIGSVPVYYFGRELKFAGNRTYADWTLQIINDEDFLVRNAMENWINNINNNIDNTRSSSAKEPSGYSVDASVTQYTKSGDKAKRYNFVGMFPLDIAPIDLDWSSNDTIEEFSITFAYQYWTATNSAIQ